jgi:hypothetical protein
MTAKQVPWMPLEIHVFVPLTTYALPSFTRTDRLQIGAAVRLGQREAAADFAAGEFRQPFALLLLGAGTLHGGRHDEVRVEDARQRHPDDRDPLDDLRVGQAGQAEPAVFLLDDRAEQAELLHLPDDFLGIGVVMLKLHRVGLDVALQEAVDRVEDHPFLFVAFRGV